MTVQQMRLLLKGLPRNMPVMLDIGEGVLVSVCEENSQVVELPFLEDEDLESDDRINEEDFETIEILLLVPCNHMEEMEEGAVNSQPELN